MKQALRALFGPLVLLIISFSVYAFRYPIWGTQFLEPIFSVLFLSYFLVFVVALLLLKKDAGKSLREFFRFHGFRWVLLGLVFVVLFQAMWIAFSLGLGGSIHISFGGLHGYESYAFYNYPVAFGLYCTFAVFGGFAEEVAYRGYVQLRLSHSYGIPICIAVSALFFALQHIHIFQPNWLIPFFQGQFIYVLFFGFFTGYFFFKSKKDLWAVFAFHGLMNIFNIASPIQASTPSSLTDGIRTILCFLLIMAFLRLFIKERVDTEPYNN